MYNLNALFKKLRISNSIICQVTSVVGGTVAAQALNTVILPVISRIYSPADYGVMAVYASVIAITTQVVSLQYHLGIALPKRSSYAYALVVSSLLIQLSMIGVFTILLYICGDYILRILSLTTVIPYKFLIPVGLLAVGTYNTLTQLCIREGLFGAIGRTKVSQCLSGAAVKIGLGLLGFRPSGLLLGTIASQAGGITTLAQTLRRQRAFGFPPKCLLRRVLIKYRKFPMYSTWEAVLNSIGTNFSPMMLSSLYSLREAGLFSMACSILHIPTTFVGSALGQVFLQRAANAKNHGNISQISIRAYTLMLRIGFYPILLISFIAPGMFAVFLGPRWADAGIYAILLVPYIAYNFTYSPMTMLYVILNKQEIALLHESIYMALRIAALLTGSMIGGPYAAVAIFSITCFFVQLYRIIYILGEAGNPRLKILYSTAYIITEELLIFVPVGLCYYYSTNMLILISSIICSVTMFCYRILKILKSEKII